MGFVGFDVVVGGREVAAIERVEISSEIVVPMPSAAEYLYPSGLIPFYFTPNSLEDVSFHLGDL